MGIKKWVYGGSQTKKQLIAVLLMVGLLSGFNAFSFQKVSFAAKAGQVERVPNERIIAKTVFKNNVWAELSSKTNPKTGEAIYSLYVINKTPEGIRAVSSKVDLFRLTAKKNPLAIQFKVFDMNQDGKEELLLQLEDDHGKDYIGYYSLFENKLKTLLEKECEAFSLQNQILTYQNFNFKYGIEEKKTFLLNAKGTLTAVESQYYEMGIRLGIDYEDFKEVLGGTYKKQYDAQMSKDPKATKRRFSVKAANGEFLFEGPKQENANTPYKLIGMTLKANGAKGLDGISVGDSVRKIEQWLESRKANNLALLYSNFLLSETMIKTNEGTIGGATEVWHFKHKNGVIYEINSEIE